MSDSTYVALDSAFGALRLKQYDVAIECFEAGRRFSPWRTDILKNLAYAYLRIGDNDKARSRFAMTVSLDTADSHSALDV